MVEIKIDRNEEYTGFLREKLKEEGLIIYTMRTILDHTYITPKWQFWKWIAEISWSNLSLQEHQEKQNKLEMTLFNPNYENNILRICQLVESQFEIKVELTKAYA